MLLETNSRSSSLSRSDTAEPIEYVGGIPIDPPNILKSNSDS